MMGEGFWCELVRIAFCSQNLACSPAHAVPPRTHSGAGGWMMGARGVFPSDQQLEGGDAHGWATLSGGEKATRLVGLGTTRLRLWCASWMGADDLRLGC